MKTGRELIDGLPLSDMSGGVATAYPVHSLNKNQVADCINAQFEKRGFSRACGYVGISENALFGGPVRGWFVYKKPDGSEAYIAVSNQKIYSVNLTLGTKTELATLTSDNECFAVNYFGKLWLVNGVDQVKIESDLTVKRIGIVAPTGFTGSAVAGGSLGVGAYSVYASYTRKISGTTVLHSVPQLVGTVTAAGGNLTVRVAVTASTDPQVTNITIWMTDAGGATHYYYGEAANTTGNIDITSATNRNPSLLMYEACTANQLPLGLTNIWVCDGRLWGCVVNSNVVYYSFKAQNVYDLEKWPTQYKIPTVPFTVLSAYGIGAHLYINTVGGFYVIPNGDVNAKPQSVIQGSLSNTNILYYPKNMLKSVVEYNNFVLGVTNDGVRIFDSEKFSIDISQHIKPQIDTITDDSGDFNPAAVVYRRSGKRTEYKLSYIDKDISTTTQNRQLVLNLDKLVIIDNENYQAPWEINSPGFCGAIVTGTNKLYITQTSSGAGVIAQEAGKADYRCLSDQGVYLTEHTKKRIYVKTRTIISELAGLTTWQSFYSLATLSTQCDVRLIITDQDNYAAPFTLAPNGGEPIILDGATPLIIPFVLPSENPREEKKKLPINARGNTMAIEFEQTANDDRFFVYEIELYGYKERNLFT